MVRFHQFRSCEKYSIRLKQLPFPVDIDWRKCYQSQENHCLFDVGGGRINGNGNKLGTFNGSRNAAGFEAFAQKHA